MTPAVVCHHQAGMPPRNAAPRQPPHSPGWPQLPPLLVVQREPLRRLLRPLPRRRLRRPQPLRQPLALRPRLRQLLLPLPRLALGPLQLRLALRRPGGPPLGRRLRVPQPRCELLELSLSAAELGLGVVQRRQGHCPSTRAMGRLSRRGSLCVLLF